MILSHRSASDHTHLCDSYNKIPNSWKTDGGNSKWLINIMIFAVVVAFGGYLLTRVVRISSKCTWIQPLSKFDSLLFSLVPLVRRKKETENNFLTN